MVCLHPRYFVLILLFAVLSFNFVLGADPTDNDVHKSVQNSQRVALGPGYNPSPFNQITPRLRDRALKLAMEDGIEQVHARSDHMYYVSFVPHNSALGREMGLKDLSGGNKHKIASVLWKVAPDNSHHLLFIDTFRSPGGELPPLDSWEELFVH
ncbi:uncharacterized protein MEPE_04109 [Melanopsichium pennsylvanicum]|uniref:Uncharacterized protein n=2 Tax=Melanopsichium pennsylvanicum TaxID=63383 RepID=A0AAJ4XMQ3_9BASI|nr:uncharacterized protein BN887_02885 [Melanopsichium pennsylvanicum 4]SNX85400.1 uncharacterized protein MEPE_04109 [Melanopsichium pennsylvanicum]